MGYIVELHEAIQSPHLAEVQYNRYIWITAGYESAADISMKKDKTKRGGGHIVLDDSTAAFRVKKRVRIRMFSALLRLLGSTI